ncbi:MAG TPA: hypothetical protein VNE58_17785 [Casimicrobiaceae bacterium]|nr:hypothetical protein [Casimicrobiaceae bacterium]
MGKPGRIGDLDIGEDIEHTRRTWTVQRAGWIAMALVVGAALLGVFGKGPLSGATRESAGLSVDFDRFARWRGEIDVRVTPAATAGRTLALTLPQTYLEQIELVAVTPPALRVEPREDRTTFVFAGATGAPQEIVFRVKPNRIGFLDGAIGVEGAAAADFRTLVFP